MMSVLMCISDTELSGVFHLGLVISAFIRYTNKVALPLNMIHSHHVIALKLQPHLDKWIYNF